MLWKERNAVTRDSTAPISNGVHEDQKALVNDRGMQRVGEEPPQHDGDAPYRVRSPVGHSFSLTEIQAHF